MTKPAWLPEGMSEGEVLAAIENVVRRLAPSFTWGHHDIEDIKQYGRLEALALLSKGKYDPSRPLEGYLFTHLKRRYLNLRRGLMRPPEQGGCRACYKAWLAGSEGCGQGTEGCRRFAQWRTTQERRFRFVHTLSLDGADLNDDALTQQDDVAQNVATRELLTLIDERLPVHLRADYLRMRAGVTVEPARREEVRAAVLAVLKTASG